MVGLRMHVERTKSLRHNRQQLRCMVLREMGWHCNEQVHKNRVQIVKAQRNVCNISLYKLIHYYYYYHYYYFVFQLQENCCNSRLGVNPLDASSIIYPIKGTLLFLHQHCMFVLGRYQEDLHIDNI